MFTPRDANGNVEVDDTVSFNETWVIMEQFVAAGKAKAIGVSNFSIKKCASHPVRSRPADCLRYYSLEKLLQTAKIVPAVNQVE